MHGNIGAPVGCDPPPKQFFRFRGKFVAKTFAVDDQEFDSLFVGVVGNYIQSTKKHQVNYEDGSTISYSADQVMKLIETFEFWYDKVSRGGRMMPRLKAAKFIVKAHRRAQIQKQAKASAIVDLSSASAAAEAEAEDADDEDEEADDARVAMAVSIKKMKVKQLREECVKAMINESGLKKVLQERLLEHYKCKDVGKEVTKGKHKCKWERKQFPATPRPFTDEAFNVTSLTQHLPSFPDANPSPGEYYGFFMTPEMWELGRTCTNT